MKNPRTRSLSLRQFFILQLDRIQTFSRPRVKQKEVSLMDHNKLITVNSISGGRTSSFDRINKEVQEGIKPESVIYDIQVFYIQEKNN